MGSVTVQGRYFLFAPYQPIATPIQDHMCCLLYPDEKGYKDCSNSHGYQDEGDRAKLETGCRTGVDNDGAWIELAEIAVDEDSGTDEEDGDQ